MIFAIFMSEDLQEVTSKEDNFNLREWESLPISCHDGGCDASGGGSVLGFFPILG